MYDGDSEGNQQNNHDSAGNWNHDSEIEESEDDNIDGSEDDDNHDTNDIKQVEEDTTVRRRNHNISNQRNRRSMVPALPSANNRTGLNRPYWQIGLHICPTLSAMVVAEQAGIRMMKEYFKIEASKSTLQYGFGKVLRLFGDEGYQAAKDKLKVNLLGRGSIDMLSWKDLT